MPDDEARELYNDIQNKNIDEKDWVDIGSYHGRAGKIDQFYFDEDDKANLPPVDQHQYQKEKENRRRDQFRRQDPKYKANHTWGHFNLFYYAVKREAPRKEEWQEKVRRSAYEWFKLHPNWVQVSLRQWFNLLGVEAKDVNVEGNAWRILEIVENTNLREAKFKK